MKTDLIISFLGADWTRMNEIVRELLYSDVDIVEQVNASVLNFEIYDDASKWIEIPSEAAEDGWTLIGLTKKGRQLRDIEIPAYISGKAVTAIGVCAFFRCRNLESVTIPDTIRKTYELVFINCPKLRSITSSADFFNAVDGAYGPLFVNCNVSEWTYSGGGLEFEFGFAPIEE